MMNAVLLLIIVGIVSLIQLKRLTDGQGWVQKQKEIWVYLGSMGIASILSVLMILQLRPPSPVVPLEMIFEQFGKAILKQ